ncbi:MAG: Matrixin [archaeon]|jgi:hypothetical protein
MDRKLKRAQENSFGFISFFFVIVLLVILAYGIYVLYLNLPGEPQQLDVILQNQPENKEVFADAKQFYPNMKFNHNVITYFIDVSCTDAESSRMKKAFEEVHIKVPRISFQEIQQKADIFITCAQSKEDINKDYFIAGEGGAKEIIDTEQYHVIVEGVIYLYDNEKKSLDCAYPNIEVHELLHVLGFDHVDDKNSIMYPFLDSCDQQLEDSIVDELDRLYTIENLPDLYFSDAQVIKKGRYLDFNVSIKNSGLIAVTDATLTIADEDTILDTYDLEDITFGGGIVMNTQNFKLKERNPKKISFIIDKENKIKEIDEKNNIIEIKL